MYMGIRSLKLIGALGSKCFRNIIPNESSSCTSDFFSEQLYDVSIETLTLSLSYKKLSMILRKCIEGTRSVERIKVGSQGHTFEYTVTSLAVVGLEYSNAMPRW